MSHTLVQRLYRSRYLLVFSVLVGIGMYLRFYNYDSIFSYGWDQARDAWKTRDIIKGQLLLEGPKTGVGDFHIGPLWFYFLVPFYMATGLDPIGAMYANILVNIFNFVSVYYVTSRIFSRGPALLATAILATSRYLVSVTVTPWNVSPIIGVSALIFYGIHQVVFHKKYVWIYAISFLTGLFTHLHVSAVFLAPIFVLSMIFAHNKRIIILTSLKSVPLFIIWLVPIIYTAFFSQLPDGEKYANFSSNFIIDGFHGRFFLHRLHDAFIQYKVIFFWPRQEVYLKFIIPAVVVFFLVFEKDRHMRILGILILIWFAVPAVVYAFYGGTTSEYYVLLNAVPAIYSVLLIQKRLLSSYKSKVVVALLLLLWIGYAWRNTYGEWVRTDKVGLVQQRSAAREAATQNKPIEFNEGVIQSYLYHIWVEDGVRF